MKLEELAAKLGVAIEDLEIDGLGKVVGLSEQMQKAAQYKSDLEAHKSELEKTKGYLSQYQQWANALAQQQQGQQQPKWDWESDPLLQPLAPSFGQLTQQIGQMQRYIQQIEAVGRNQFNQYEIDRLKVKYGTDFDPDRVREYAVRTNDARNWEDVYHAERGSRVDDIVKERLEAAQKEERAGTRRRLAEVHTEIEGATPRVGPRAQPPDWDQAFVNLENTLAEELGFE